MSKIKIAIITTILFLALFTATAVLATGDYGLGDTAGAAGLNKGNLPTLAGNVIGTALSMVGVLFFILMVYGGFLWMTARGKEETANKAKDTIIAAIIGIIIVLSAYAITNFVFSSLSGTSGGFSGNYGDNSGDNEEPYRSEESIFCGTIDDTQPACGAHSGRCEFVYVGIDSHANDWGSMCISRHTSGHCNNVCEDDSDYSKCRADCIVGFGF